MACVRYSRLAWTAVSIFFIISVAPAHAWWNGEWTLRRKITIDTTQAGSGITDVTGAVPVLIRLHEGDFSFASARADGSDLRFVAEDDKTLLPFHLERIDPVLDEAYVWVKLPEVKPGSKQTLWLYYGNNGNKAGKVEDPKGTYDADTALVYHFSEKGQPPYDFSGSGNAAQTTPTSVEGSLIAGGARLDGHTALVIAGENMPWIDRGTWTASL